MWLATADNLQEAFTNALECDRTSAFGSIVGLNRKVTIQTANTIREVAKSGIKIEAVIAPSYTEKACVLCLAFPTVGFLKRGDS